MGLFKNIVGRIKSFADIDSTDWGLFTGIGSYRSNDLLSKRSDNQVMSYYRSWVKVAVDAIAEKVGEIEFVLKDVKGEIVEKHQILDTLRSPNEYNTQYTFFHRLMAYYLLAGEAPIYKQNGTKSKTLILLPPVGFRGVWNKDGTKLSHYELPVSGGTVRYELEQIIPFFAFNPNDPMDGFSSTRSNIYAIESMIELENWEYQFFARGGIPPWALSYDDKLTKIQSDKIKTRVMQDYNGSNNAFQPLILSGGAKMMKTGLTPKDVELTAIEIGIRDKVLGQYRVPKAVVGAVDDVNRANAEASLYTFMLNTVKPKMSLITDMLNKFYVSEFGEGLYLEFVDPVPENRAEEATVRKTRGAWVTINELREEEGLEALPDGDVFIGTSNTLDLTSLNNAFETKMRSLSDKVERYKLLNKVDYKDDEGALIKMLDRVAKNYEARWIKSYAQYARDLEERLVASLRDNKSIKVRKALEDLYDANAEVSTIIDILRLFYADIGNESILDAIALLEVENLDPDILNSIVAQFYTPILEKTALTIARTVKDRISSTLLSGLEEGEGIDDLAKRIRDVADWMKTSQAEAIAETETTKITNGAFQITYEQSGAPYKAWVNLGDGRVRESHNDDSVSANNNGFVIPTDDSFLIGGEYLKYPGDPSGSADNVIRCRCRIVAKWERPEDSERGFSLEDHHKACGCKNAKSDASYKFYSDTEKV